ncbi:LOW QUALITY PROTEIN: hypothetical protein BRADI_4g39742v3 [Brachypodium distachyon]|uniref:Uncharacterized protein n=1 Tax=Brachypodium distachyon TaxID=15368 RepID=A0A2K2CTD4_BRADI|nr:LOW QUALITY PROTEIN: hypothetical protein BRADI_4g39742v3 [Brachypodium distachyon]
MASVERAVAKAAAALLPGLLRTPPPMSTPAPAPCIIILPAASNPKFPKPGRADAVERWDAHKNRPRSPASSCGSTSPGRADSCLRWDMNEIKKNPRRSKSSSSSMSISGERYKRPLSCASSADRWDAHKKPRDAVSDAESRTSDQSISKDKKQQLEDETRKMEETAPHTHLVFSGPTFVASPEPSKLPMPAFFARRSGMTLVA